MYISEDTPLMTLNPRNSHWPTSNYLHPYEKPSSEGWWLTGTLGYHPRSHYHTNHCERGKKFRTEQTAQEAK
jgi:hypothetical protein